MTISRRIFLTFSILLLLPFYGLSQNTASQESRKAALEKEIAQLETQLKENNAKSASATNELSLVRKKISARKELISESDREIGVIDDSIAVATRAADTLKARVDTLTIYYHTLVRNAYKNRDARVWFIYLLSSKNIGQAARRYAYLRDLSSKMNAQARKMKAIQSELAAKLAQLEILKSRAESMKASRQKELDTLNSEEKRSNVLVAQLNRNKKKYQQSLDTKKRQVKALNNEISRIISQYLSAQAARKPKASSSQNGSNAAPAKEPARAIDYTLASKFEANRGKLPWPANGPVTEKFGRHNHPVFTNLVMPFNNGINIGLSRGAEVRAVFDGVVRSVIVMPGYNKCVLIQHGNYFTFYCKLGSVSVRSGTSVKTGQVLGTVDTIDGQTELHFQVWRDRNPENPEYWLRPR